MEFGDMFSHLWRAVIWKGPYKPYESNSFDRNTIINSYAPESSTCLCYCVETDRLIKGEYLCSRLPIIVASDWSHSKIDECSVRF
jgi:hypothetical protein